MLDRTGETTPPCGAPESVAFHSQSSRYPAWSICLIVSIRKSCERACRGPTWRFAVATPVLALSARGLSGGRGPCPGAEVFGAGVPWEEAFQCRAGERFPAVAAAFVEVCGQVGQDVQPG